MTSRRPGSWALRGNLLGATFRGESQRPRYGVSMDWTSISPSEQADHPFNRHLNWRRSPIPTSAQADDHLVRHTRAILFLFTPAITRGHASRVTTSIRHGSEDDAVDASEHLKRFLQSRGDAGTAYRARARGAPDPAGTRSRLPSLWSCSHDEVGVSVRAGGSRITTGRLAKRRTAESIGGGIAACAIARGRRSDCLGGSYTPLRHGRGRTDLPRQTADIRTSSR